MAAPTLEARVKSVLSGDTVVLMHLQKPTEERILSLAYVSAPRMRREHDEVSFGIHPSPIIPQPVELSSCRCQQQTS